MLCIENLNTDPYLNHGLEEWLMQHLDQDCFMLWRNQKAILLGKNQNAYSQINMPYAKEHSIKIVRRITGGGTVFTDEGNIMFTFISCQKKLDSIDFRKFTVPILEGLRSLGVPAEFSGRNDLVIDEKKFSGNAQCRYRNKILHHGTLMFTANTDELVKALNVREIKLRDKGVDSVRSRVTNLAEHLPVPMEIEAFRAYLFKYVTENTTGATPYSLTEDDWREAAEIARTKYADPQWIYGKSPDIHLHREMKFAGGIVETYIDTHKGMITAIKIHGDFFGDKDVSEIEDALVGALYETESVRKILEGFHIGDYLHNITLDELVTALCN